MTQDGVFYQSLKMVDLRMKWILAWVLCRIVPVYQLRRSFFVQPALMADKSHFG